MNCSLPLVRSVLLIGPEASGLNLDASTSSGKKHRTKLVRGCPCYKEFAGLEKEKICLNNDDILPINAISVDPSFFKIIESVEDLTQYKSDNASMCYLLIYLDRNEGFCYCVSQAQRISINEKDVKVSEIDSALQFVTSIDRSRDGVICSDCLYKYLRTLGEASTGFLTDVEREEIINSYVHEVSMRVAAELTSYSSNSASSRGYENHVKQYIKRINDSRSQWAALTTKLKKANADRMLLELVEDYRAFYRLEAIFLSQVLDFETTSSELDALGTLKFIVSISEKVIQLSDTIRDKTNYLIEQKKMSRELQEKFMKHAEKRKNTEYSFSNLVSVLSEIDAHTTQ
jgi:hypothetical protein